jgi:diacylglycerol O-acyltransferase
MLLGSGLRSYARALRVGPPSHLTGPLGAARGYGAVSVRINDLQAIKARYGATLNDVVLSLATTGIRDLLVARGEPLAPHVVRCLVPVSVRPPGDDMANNQVSAILLELPTEFADPGVRLHALVARTRKLKASNEAAAGAALTSLARWAPPQLVTMGVHTAMRVPQRAITTVVTNVPGPRGRLYVLGRRMLAHYPYVPIADRIRIGIAVTSYDGQLYFGITSDRESVPDAAVLRAGIERGLDELADTLKTTAREG